MTGERARFLRGTASLQASGLTVHVAQLFSSAALAALLGAHDQGLYALAVTLNAGVFFLLNVGVVPAAVTQVAAAHARGLADKRLAWIAHVAKVGVLSSLAAAALGLLVLPALAGAWFDERAVGWWAWALSLQTMLDLPRTVVTVALQGTRRMGALGRLELVVELLRAACVPLGAWIMGSVSGAIGGAILGSVAGAALVVRAYSAQVRGAAGDLPSARAIARRAPSVPLLRGLRLGLRVSLTKNAHVLIVELAPRLVVGGLSGASYVAWLHIAQRIVAVPLVLMAAVTRNALPYFGELFATAGIQAVRRAFLRISVGTALGIALCVGLMLLVVSGLVTLVYPADYVRPVTTYVQILAVGLTLYALGSANAPFFIATNSVRFWFSISLPAWFTVLPLAVWVAANSRPYGIAWSVVILQSYVAVMWFAILLRTARTTPADRTASAPPGTRSGRA